MKKLPRSKKVLEYALVSISALKSFLVGGVGGWGGAWPILMSTPGPFLHKGEVFLTCVADLGGTSGPDLELDKKDLRPKKCHYWMKLRKTVRYCIKVHWLFMASNLFPQLIVNKTS